VTADAILDLRRRRPDLSKTAIAMHCRVSRWRVQSVLVAAGLAEPWAGRGGPYKPRRRIWPTGHRCVVCREPIPRHELDTDATHSSRDVCSRACMRVVKGTQAERGRMRLTQETGP
jgi:hypothetical protein